MILETKRAIKPLLTRQPSDDSKCDKHAGDGNAEQLQYVALLVMANCMREHRFQFPRGKLRDESVEQDNFSKASEPGENGAGVARAFAAIHQFAAARGNVVPLRY